MSKIKIIFEKLKFFKKNLKSIASYKFLPLKAEFIVLCLDIFGI